jgi:hypothetical protein
MIKLLLDENKLEEYKAEYSRTHCVFLPGLIRKPALETLLGKLERTEFKSKFEFEEEHKFGKVLCVPFNDPLTLTVHLLFNDQKFFGLLERISGCSTIGNFIGRIHRSEEGKDHEIDWHGDNADQRLLAMTVGLGTDRYTGAQFELREKHSGRILRRIDRVGAGDAFIFGISPELQHRLTMLETGRRTVGVGWFRSQPDLRTFMKSQLAAIQNSV